MRSKIVVQRLESGNRTEYHFKNLEKALQFIKQSEKNKKKKIDGEWTNDGSYEIYMPRYID